jgi:hypothetical protein
MTKKKDSTDKKRKADYSWGSFALSMKETREIADELADFLHDAPDEILLLVMVLVNSFTYTRDHSQREYMRSEICTALMSYFGAARKAMDDAAADAYRRAVGEGGAS